ncbi:MAG: DUF1553 domain-containing protein [Planctomycetota bacterium]|nr:DUF1553 domain-containing protein [Planctomycetota bacterium]
MKRTYLILIAAASGLGFWSLQPEKTVADEGTVTSTTRTKAVATARMIDARIDQAIRKAGLEPAPQAGTSEILRRLSLDLNGTIPSSQTVVKFNKSRKKDKLIQVIDAMLEDNRFNEHWSNVLTSAWVGRKRRRNSGYFRAYLKDKLAKKTPFDKLVRDVLTAKGAVDDNGASYFTLRWDTQPTNVAAQSARVFMGLQIQCAQCHDHPFSEWKQEQFHHFAAYFSQLRRGNKKKGDQNIPLVNDGQKRPYRYKLKSTGMDKTFNPKFLFEFDNADEVSSASRRSTVAGLMTHPENPYFARMTVNRVWKTMYGRGLVEPVEDLEGSAGYHPMLLEFVAQDFIASGYDLRHLIRSIALSRAYQRSSKRPASQKDPAAAFEKLAGSKNIEKREAAAIRAQEEVWLFGRASLRALTPEQIADSLLRATVPSVEGMQEDDKYMEKFTKLRGNLVRQFDQLYDEAEAANPDAFDGTIPQTLIMLNGKFVNEAIKPQKGTMMAYILQGSKSPKTVISTIFLAVLSRKPTKSELRKFTGYITSRGANNQTYEDLMWALINSSDFLMNH